MAGTCSTYGEKRGSYSVLVGKPEGKRSLGNIGVDGKMILKRIFKNWDRETWTGLIWLRIGAGGGHS